MSTLQEKLKKYKKNRPTDTRSNDEKQIGRENIEKRIQLYKKQQEIIREQNEMIENQAAEIKRLKSIMEERLGNPLQTINRDSPLTIVYPEQTMSQKN